MNPPSDPTQLLVYGIATFLVVLGLKLWDRRRDKRLQNTAEEAKRQATKAAAHASTAAESAGAAAAASGRAEQTTGSRASGEQAREILQVGHDTNAMLVQIAMSLGEVKSEVRSLRRLASRVAQIEEHLDDLVLPGTARKRHER